jgi:Concanavalin A-like lectin/glucanases superfamily
MHPQAKQNLLSTIVFSAAITLLVGGVMVGRNNNLNYQTLTTADGASAQTAPVSYGLNFNGTNQYATLTNLPATLRSVYTYELWVKRLADRNGYETYFSDANSSYSSAMVTLFVDGSNESCPAGPSDEFAYFQMAGSQDQCSGVTAELNRWYHIAISRDASGVRRMFIDGQLVNSQTNTVIANDSSGRLTLGRAGQSNSEYFAGRITQVRISSTARYTSNFTRPQAMMQADSATFAYWPLSEGSGQRLNNSSSATQFGFLGSSESNTTGDAAWVQDSPYIVGSTPVPTISTPIPTSSTPTATRSPSPTPTRTPSPTPTIIPTVPPTLPPVGGGFGTALRFFGTGTNDVDRVKIPLNTNNTSTRADVGGDFTLEWWMKANRNDNSTAGLSCEDGGDNWVTGNMLFDRDIFNDGDYGDYGVSMRGGRIIFGVNRQGTGTSICAPLANRVDDGQWHHVSVTRAQSTGILRIFVDGIQVRQGNGPTGDISYRDNRPTNWANEPYLVIAAEKHDYSKSEYPSYNGIIDEVRISDNIRYSANFARPTVPFTTDANTRLLYHFDEAAGLVVTDSSSSTNPVNGEIRRGGAQQGPQYVNSL